MKRGIKIICLMVLLNGCGQQLPVLGSDGPQSQMSIETGSVEQKNINKNKQAKDTSQTPKNSDSQSNSDLQSSLDNSNDNAVTEKNPFSAYTKNWYEWNSQNNKYYSANYEPIPWDYLNLSKAIKEWQTYSNDEFGFGIKYPARWDVENLDAEYTIFGVKSYLFVKFIDNRSPYAAPSFENNNVANVKIFDAQNLPLQEWLKQYNIYPPEEMISKLSEEAVTINGIKSMKYLEGGPNSTIWIAYYFKNDKKNFVYRYKYLAGGDEGEPGSETRKLFEAYKEIWELMLPTLTLK